MALLDDIESMLAGIAGGDTGWTISKGFMPATPDKVIAIYEYDGGEPPDQSGAAFDFPYFQVRGRGDAFGYQDLRQKMRDVYQALHNTVPIDGDNSPPGSYVYCFAVQSSPMPLGLDGSNRPSMSWNFKTMRSRD